MRKIVKGILAGIAITTGLVVEIRHIKKKINASEKNLGRLSQYYDILLDWIDNMQQNRKIANVLLEENYRKIAIYGKGTLGFLLYKELQDSGVSVEYFIDQTADKYSFKVEDTPVIGIQQVHQMNSVDAIIVTPIHVYESIKKDLVNNSVTVPVFSLNDMILDAK